MSSKSSMWIVKVRTWTVCFLLGVCLNCLVNYCASSTYGMSMFGMSKTPTVTVRHSTIDSEALDPKPHSLKKARILCYINTIPKTYYTKAIHVKQTWGSDCDKLLFFSSKADSVLPVIDLHLNQTESRMHLWSKMRAILRVVYQYRNEYDYFFKGDDDTHMFPSNLLDQLRRYNASDPFMIGHRFMRFTKVGYFSGGAGYLLSREALIRIVERSIDKHPSCPTYDEDMEDVKMSICGQLVGVKLYNALDYRSRNKFLWMKPKVYFQSLKWIPPPIITTNNSLTSSRLPIPSKLISFHYVAGSKMYLMHLATRFLKVSTTSG